MQREVESVATATTAGTARALRLFDLVALLSFAALWVTLFRKTLQAHPPTWVALGALLSLPLGYAFADFASGVLHWFGDRFFREDTPVLGPIFIRPFREHHLDPLALTHHGLLELSGNSAVAAIPALAACLAALEWSAELPVVFGAQVMLWATPGAVATNHAHKWAHMREVPAAVAWLQRHRIILSPEHHGLHHAGRHDRAYCVTSGWLNPLLDRWQFFRRTEALLRRGVAAFRR